jgi:hypothetical protein
VAAARATRWQRDPRSPASFFRARIRLDEKAQLLHRPLASPFNGVRRQADRLRVDRLAPRQPLPELLGQVRHHRVEQAQRAVEDGQQHLGDPGPRCVAGQAPASTARCTSRTGRPRRSGRAGGRPRRSGTPRGSRRRRRGLDSRTGSSAPAPPARRVERRLHPVRPATRDGRSARRSRSCCRRRGSPPSARRRAGCRAPARRGCARVKRTASAPYSATSSAGRGRCPWSSTSSALRRRAPARSGGRWRTALAGEVEAGHHHPGDPEEEDVEAGDQHVGRVERRSRRSRPASRGSRTARAPRRTRCRARRVLGQLGAPASLPPPRGCARRRVAVGVVPGRDLVPPPELARDAPRADVLQPVLPGLRPRTRAPARGARRARPRAPARPSRRRRRTTASRPAARRHAAALAVADVVHVYGSTLTSKPAPRAVARAPARAPRSGPQPGEGARRRGHASVGGRSP